MCGIAGCFAVAGVSPAHADTVRGMNESQGHRGPDDEGLWQGGSCVLGHRRLSIIDLSAAGHQPFVSPDGRYVLTYNGEIYNYIELRAELKAAGVRFRTRTDTEVLLQAYVTYGDACLQKFNGMFAFAVYDTVADELFLARDRVGIKPLYYCRQGDGFYFASEIKAFRCVPGFSPSVDNQAVFDYLVFNRTDVFDETFLTDVRRIPKGHCAVCGADGLRIRQWWNPEDSMGDRLPERESDVFGELEKLVVSATALRMRSDVPVGSCLSGGLDSSILTGIIFSKGLAGDRYATFTSSFPGHPIDETAYIDILKKRFPFENYRTFPDAGKAFDALDTFVRAMDEPTNDATFFSQYEVMRLAKEKGVTVLIDGQGGDENFAGYQYFHGFYLAGLLRQGRLLHFGRELVNVILRRQHRSAYQTLAFQLLPGVLRKRLLLTNAPLVDHTFFHDYIGSSRIYNGFFDVDSLNRSLVRHFQYKLEHLLRMEDRNSMAFGLEARVPYLDHRLIEYVLGLADRVKIRAGQTKYLQKQALAVYTVPEILDRRDKIGFGTPRDEWMAEPCWEEKTRESLGYVRTALPGVLDLRGGLPAGSVDRWKINQLAVWHGHYCGG